MTVPATPVTQAHVWTRLMATSVPVSQATQVNDKSQRSRLTLELLDESDLGGTLGSAGVQGLNNTSWVATF